MPTTRGYRFPFAGGRALRVRVTDTTTFAAVDPFYRADTFQAVDLDITGGGAVAGVVYDVSSTAVVDAVVVGSDPGSHGLHVDHPHPPRFYAAVTITAVNDGLWSDTATWDLGRIPTTGDVVRVPSQLVFSAAGNRKLTCNLLVCNTDGTLVMDYSGTTNTCEVVFADAAINTTLDPYQWGHGLILLGDVSILGKPKTAWRHLATEALAGATTIVLDAAPTGWQVGDKIVLPDTRQLAQMSTLENPLHTRHLDQGQFDERTVAGVSGATITLNAALTYDHVGARDRLGNIDIHPVVMNLSRNVVFKSANPAGSRGHAFSHGRVVLDVKHAEFRDLGRSTWLPFDSSAGVTPGTNQKGRYGGFHLHHTVGPLGLAGDVPQFTFAGNSCWCQSGIGVTPPRWGLTIHESHYGLVEGNGVYNFTGSGLVTEGGNELGNVIDGNCVMRVPATGTGEGSRGLSDIAHSGQGLWIGGVRNYVRNNVSTCTNKHYSIVPQWSPSASSYYAPAYKGADTYSGVDADRVLISAERQPILEFDNNEGYGRGETGIDIWSLNNAGGTPNPVPNAALSIVDNMRVGHTVHSGYYNYTTANVTFRNPVMRGDFAVLRAGQSNSVAIFFSDYSAQDFKLVGGDIQGYSVGFLCTTTTNRYEVTNTSFACYRNVECRSTFSTLCVPFDMPARDLVLTNVVHLDPLCPVLGGAGYKGKIIRDGALFAYPTNRLMRDRLFVYDHDGVPGDDFQVYYLEQRGSSVLEQTYSGSGTVAETVLRIGTAQGGTANTITLDAGASAVTDFYVNNIYNGVALVGGNAVPLFPLYMAIVAYNGTTKVATVQASYTTGLQGYNWTVIPDNTSRFIVFYAFNSTRLVGSPDAGKTNTQNFADYGICTAGEITPGGATTRTGITGDCVAI